MRIIPPPGGTGKPASRARVRNSVPVPESQRRKALAYDVPLEEALGRALARAQTAQAQVRDAFAGRVPDMAARIVALAERRARGDARAEPELALAARELATTAPVFEAALVARISESLARLLSDPRRAPSAHLVDAHAGALAAALREGARDDDPIARALVAELERAVAAHLGGKTA